MLIAGIPFSRERLGIGVLLTAVGIMRDLIIFDVRPNGRIQKGQIRSIAILATPFVDLSCHVL